MGNPSSRFGRCPEARRGGMGKDAWFCDFDMKSAANFSSKVIGGFAHNCIWSRRDPLTWDSRQFEKSIDGPARIGATSCPLSPRGGQVLTPVLSGFAPSGG